MKSLGKINSMVKKAKMVKFKLNKFTVVLMKE